MKTIHTRKLCDIYKNITLTNKDIHRHAERRSEAPQDSAIFNVATQMWTEAIKRRDAARAELSAAAQDLDTAIKSAEGRATARTITADDVIETLCNIEAFLGISKKALKGVSVCVDVNAQNFPGLYRYQRLSTWFSAKHNGAEWVIMDIWRDDCARKNAGLTITHTSESQAAILVRFTKRSAVFYPWEARA